jgi:hypothetical protein
MAKESLIIKKVNLDTKASGKMENSTAKENCIAKMEAFSMKANGKMETAVAKENGISIKETFGMKAIARMWNQYRSILPYLPPFHHRLVSRYLCGTPNSQTKLL